MMDAEASATAGAGARDPAAMCEALWQPLVGMLTVRMRDRPVAEELAQEALARMWVHWPTVAAMQYPESWVYRVALNLSNSYFRRRSAERRANQRVGVDDTTTQIEVVDGIVLRELIGGLTRRQQEVIALRYYVGMSVKETARTLRVSEGTVKTLTHRAVQRLQSLIPLEGFADG